MNMFKTVKLKWFYIVCVLALAVGVSSETMADEGMYPLDSAESLPLEKMKKQGLKIDANQILEMRQAVVKVAGGGSGSFVSKEGLVVTNHHVAYGCIAALDGLDKYKGIMDKGFVAETQKEELSCPGYDLLVVKNVRDISEAVIESIGKKKGHRRFEAIRLKLEELETECQQDGSFCSAEPLDGGNAYHMMVYTLVKDVRLVYSPPKDLGKYGGDVDNWRYPRHTADFTFLRAYVDSNGKGKPFSSANVPFEPKHVLKVSDKGIAKDDMVLVMGFPARTKRNFPAATAHFSSKIDMPTRSKFYKGVLSTLDTVIKGGDEQTGRRYQRLQAGLNNAVKYYADSMAGFEKWQIIQKREAREKGLHRRTLRHIDRVYKNYERIYEQFFMLTRLSFLSKSVGTAFNMAMWEKERTKLDKDRKEDTYKSKNMYKVIEQSDFLDKQMTLQGERAIFTYLMQQAEKLPPKRRIKAVRRFLRWGQKEAKKIRRQAQKEGIEYSAAYQKITGTAPSKDKVKTAVDLMFGTTKLIAKDTTDAEQERAMWLRRRLFYGDKAFAKNYNDPMLVLARGLAKEYRKIKEGPVQKIDEKFGTELRSKYAKLIGAAYPDANFQLRLSHGIVDDYTAYDTKEKHRYITDVAGLLAKDKGAFPFNVPANFKAAAQKDKGRFVDPNINDVPIDFTTTLDTTGGNSGSAVMDGQGRLVGLLFDGTPESVLSDWQFLQNEQRSIVMDIRIALFMAEKVDNAQSLLEELGVK